MARPGALFVLTGPSGVGKSTLRARLLGRLDWLTYSVSCTTRPPRPGERDGRDYHFLTRSQFKKRVSQGAFLEWAWVFGQGYGTLKDAVRQNLDAGRDVLLEIDVQGAAQVRRKARTLGTAVHFIFVLPPSLDTLGARLRGRRTEDPAEAHRRLKEALKELAHAPRFEFLVVNRDLEAAVLAIARFVRAARASR